MSRGQPPWSPLKRKQPWVQKETSAEGLASHPSLRPGKMTHGKRQGFGPEAAPKTLHSMFPELLANKPRALGSHPAGGLHGPTCCLQFQILADPHLHDGWKQIREGHLDLPPRSNEMEQLQREILS